MIKCLVFGGGGFIGSHLAEGLVKGGYNVKIFDNFPKGIINLATIKNKVEIIEGDFLLNEDDIDFVLKDVDYVFHYISTNAISDIIGSIKLFQAVVKSNVRRFIFASSGGTIYGEPEYIPISETQPTNPFNPYAISKLTIENYLQYFHRVYGLDYTILRYSNPYGERQNPHGVQGVVPIFLNKIKEGQQPVIYGDGSMIRDYIYIKDAVAATIAVVEKSINGIFNIGSGEGTSLNELVSTLAKVTGKKITPTYMEDNKSYTQKVVLDISKIWDEAGWKPNTNLRDGVQKTWEWILNLHSTY